MKWLLMVLGVALFGMFLRSELPAMKRYIKIERM